MPGLSAAEGAAWASVLRAHALLTRQLDADLRAVIGLTLSEFEVLLHLSWAGGERRMAQLADDVVLTGGGVTRIVGRLERLGLIDRRSCPKDGRGIFAVLTEKGRKKQQAAHRIHLEGIRRLFLDGVPERDLAAISRVFGGIVQRGRDGNGPGADGACGDRTVRAGDRRRR